MKRIMAFLLSIMIVAGSVFHSCRNKSISGSIELEMVG